MPDKYNLIYRFDDTSDKFYLNTLFFCQVVNENLKNEQLSQKHFLNIILYIIITY